MFAARRFCDGLFSKGRFLLLPIIACVLTSAPPAAEASSAPLTGRRAELTHEYRFPNVLRNVGGALSWDYPALLENVIRSLVDSAPFGIRSVGIDTWGLDFGLLDEKASLLEWPVSYRDLRTEGVMEAVTGALRPGNDHIGAPVSNFSAATLSISLPPLLQSGPNCWTRRRHC